MELKEVFEPIINFLKNFQKRDKEAVSKDKAKERLQLVLMQDRASVSPDFFEMMKKDIIEVIKKYIEIDEETLEVQLTRGFEGDDGTGPAIFANIPIKNIKPVAKAAKEEKKEQSADDIANDIIEEIKAVAEEKTEQVEKAKEEIIEEVTAKVEDGIDKIKEEAKEAAEAQEKVAEEEKQNAQQENVNTIKEKIDDIKDEVSETITKVKNGAKEGIKKNKSKAKARN